jgi:hypothetical protein
MEFTGIDRLHFNGRKENKETYLWHIIFSCLYFLAKAINEGLMIPPRSRKVPDAGSTLQKSQPRIRESWNKTKFHCHPQKCYKKKG